MAKTLLNCVNEILKRTAIIAGDSGLLASLTDSARQVWIDAAVQVVNEGIDDLYAATNIAMPSEQAEGSMVLVTGTRAYTLASGLRQLRFPMIDKTNTQYIHEYPGGYNEMLIGDPEQSDTGLPYLGAFRTTDGLFYVDRAPTSVENGRTYTYQYDKDLAMTTAAATVPFNDMVFRAMVPVWVQLWKREQRNEFDTELYRKSLGLASALLSQRQARDSYSWR